MSLLRPAGVSLPSFQDREGQAFSLANIPADLMSDDERALEKHAEAGLAAHEDARALVRLIQCSQCSRPLRLPVTLPCGNSICRQCLPGTYEREGISYPDLPGRRQALRCPFMDCGSEHSLMDCNIDVTLSKLMDSIGDLVAKHASMSGGVLTSVEEIVKWDEDESLPSCLEKRPSHDLQGGRLLATYTLAAQGQLDCANDLEYMDDPASGDRQRALDASLLAEISETVHKEVDCQVCYNLMLDPVTTFCGHTFCRKCLARVLDHSLHCPVCRRDLVMPPSLLNQPSNKTIVRLLSSLCPEAVSTRAEAVVLEESAGEGGLNVPLFVCTLGFPGQPTFLRIFEPRYRLMVRRCLEGNREFGMLMYNRYFEPQGELGPVHFYHYGTMLQIRHSEMMPDGTSILETRGTYRFRVTGHGIMDGYAVGSVERIEDVPLAEEERIEANETSLPPADEGDLQGLIDRMSTQELLALGQDFILRMLARSATWLQQRVLDIHGQPPTDAALFPFWFASVLPISDEEKYKLLPTTTVRQRLKITASWIRRIESQRWYQSNSCQIL